MGEGDEDVGEDDGGVGVDCDDDDGPGGVPAPPGESPPSCSSSLTFSIDGRRVSPLVLGSHGVGGARAPPRLDLSLSVSALQILAFHRFLYSRRSVTPTGLKFEHDFYPDIGFLAAKEGHQPPYRGWARP